MKELVVISGKGGTGKTSIAASFAVLADRPVIADCDVDAADMHLLLHPEQTERNDFYSGHEAVIRAKDCTGCGICLERCRYNAIVKTGESSALSIDPIACEGCGVCVWSCPEAAIDFPERHCGEWMISRTRCGPMVHARLGTVAENSGKLVSLVRKTARSIAEKGNYPLIIVDGPPGIGCPVIASMSGASMVLVVTEPTVSGLHDMERVLSLTQHFRIPAFVCINKWDINTNITARIEGMAQRAGAEIAGRVAYDCTVAQAQIEAKTVVEVGAPSASDIKNIWYNIQNALDRI